MKSRLILLLVLFSFSIILTLSISTNSEASTNVIASSFSDVPISHWGHDYIDAIHKAGYVAGCHKPGEPAKYCPDNNLNRAEMAVFIVRGVHGAGFVPPTPTTQIFTDVKIDGSFWAAPWIHQLWKDGFTAGCQQPGESPKFCPYKAHTRAEAAVFFLRMKHNKDYDPPNSTGIFVDLPSGWWGSDWSEAAYKADLIPPCQIYPSLKFCPNEPVSRAMAAYMMAKAKNLIASPDIRVDGLEITQGIQNLANQIPLIGRRPTYVRVHVHTGLLRDIRGVPAELHGTRNNVPLPGSPLKPRNSGQVLTIPVGSGINNRLETDESFWFYIPYTWLSGNVKFRVEVNNYLTVPEHDIAGNAMEVTRTFNNGDTLHLGMVRLEIYDEGDTTNPPLIYDTTDPNFDDLLWNIARLHPVSDLRFYRSEDIVTPGAGHSVWDLREEADCSDLLRAIYEADIFRSSSVDYRMGMVHPSLNTECGKPGGGWAGLARLGGIQSWVKMRNSHDGQPDWFITGGQTMAHELGHNMGLKHVSCSGSEKNPDPDYPWPYPNCALADVSKSGYYGFDTYYAFWNLSFPEVISNDPNASRPHQGFPIMGYKRPRWVSPWEYCKLLNEYGVTCNTSTLFSNANSEMNQYNFADTQNYVTFNGSQVIEAATNYIAAGGIIDLIEDTAEFKFLYKLENPSMSALQQAIDQLNYASINNNQTNPPYTIVQTNADGQTVHSQELYFGLSEWNRYQLFLELVPFAEGATRIQIRHGNTTLIDRAASANPPSIQLLEPNGGEMLESGTTIHWAATDVDGDALKFNILYTPDDGQTWRVIRMGLDGTSFEIPSINDLPASNNQGRIRIVANDGFHTVEDQSDNTFSVPGSPPLVFAFPASGSYYEQGTMILLQGIATDMDDGPLFGDSLTWVSDKDGFLGTGERLEVETLSQGTHVITLTAVDSDNEVAEKSIVLNIGINHVVLPLVVNGSNN